MLRFSSVVLATFASSVVLVGNALASTFYVSPSPLVGPGTDCTFPNFNSVQAAVTAALPGDTVVVCDGVYQEQVTVTKNLTLLGSGNSELEAPAVPLTGDLDLVTIGGAASVAMSGFVVSGPGPGGCASIAAGIRVRDGATLDLGFTTVRDIRDAPFGGCQSGEGIRVGSRGGIGGPGHATIDNVIVAAYQKNGVTVAGAGSTANIMNTTVRGTGATTVIAQNGIQVSSGAAATITTSTIRDNDYTPNSYFACGLLILDAAGVNDDNNVFLNNEKNKCTALGRGGTYEGMP